jgi:GDSL-like Lipase/Acylhydrolase.
MMRRIGMTMMLVLCGFIAIHAQQSLHVVMLGDSNTFIGGDDCSKPQGWNKWFKDLMNPISCRSYARSGATWTETPNTVYDINEYTEVLSDNNVIYNQVSRLLADVFDTKTQPVPDLILIMAGTNDLWFADKRPEPFPKYIRQNCEMLKHAFPHARIVLITPPPIYESITRGTTSGGSDDGTERKRTASGCHPTGSDNHLSGQRQFQGRRSYDR